MNRVRFIPILMLGMSAQIRVDVGLVTVACEVTDSAGAPAKNLRAEDFEVRDNGRDQKVEHLWQEQDLPLTIGLLVDEKI